MVASDGTDSVEAVQTQGRHAQVKAVRLDPIKASPRRRPTRVLMATGLGAVVLLIAGVALAVHENTLFELDGNAVAELLEPGDDWSPDPPGANEFVFATDLVESPSDDIFATNSKDTIDISAWQWKVGEPNDKNDIEHGYVAAYTDGAGDQIIYFGMDFLANNGDKAVGIWILQDDVVQVDDGTPPNLPFSGAHEDGDILLQADFTNGGQISRVDVYTWGTNSGLNQTVQGGPLTLAFEGQDCDDEAAGDPACANVNDDSVPAPWPYEYKCVAPLNRHLLPAGWLSGASGVQTLNIFPISTFFEGGVNVSEVLGRSICGGTVLFETRQSQSETSVLEDKLLADFDLCSISVVKDGPDLSKVGDDVSYTVTIENDGSIRLYKESIIDSLQGDLTNAANYDSSDCGVFLDPGDTCTIEYTYTVQGGDPDPLLNTVDVVYDNQSDLAGDDVTDSDGHSVDLFQPGISVVKTGDDLSKVGDDVSYTVTITNDSSSDSPDLVFDLISDSLQGDLTNAANFDSSTCGASFAWDESCQIDYTYTVQGVTRIRC